MMLGRGIYTHSSSIGTYSHNNKACVACQGCNGGKRLKKMGGRGFRNMAERNEQRFAALTLIAR